MLDDILDLPPDALDDLPGDLGDALNGTAAGGSAAGGQTAAAAAGPAGSGDGLGGGAAGDLLDFLFAN